MTANEPRKITVQRENPIWQEYDREVKVEIWHNRHQTTAICLSPEEATILHAALTAHLIERRGAE